MKTPQSAEWNAADYHRLSAPQFQWGQRVLDSLHLRGDECVLDAGCGTGKLTRLLLANLPRGRAVGVDLSRNMVQHARAGLQSDFGGNALFVVANFLALPFSSCFDGIFSTAAFHWIKDHDQLFRNLFIALRAGGWLHAQCGGGPNLKRLRERVQTLSQRMDFAPYLAHFAEPWFFASAEDAAHRLQKAGFVEVQAGLEEAPFPTSSSTEFQSYLRTFVLHRHLELLPSEDLRQRFLEELANQCAGDHPPWTLDYWRLNLRARKTAK
jgi:trans-aconitate methyltransferase